MNKMNLPTFKKLVDESWSKAVDQASRNIDHYRDELIESLKSPNTEERSAAVTSFSEANDSTVYDLVIKLIDDPDREVRKEVFEYLLDFGKKEDIKLIFGRMHENYEDLYFITKILQNLTGRNIGTILDDDPKELIEKEINDWKIYLSQNGYI